MAGVFAGLNVCFTGTHTRSRNQLVGIIASNGGVPNTTVTRQTNVLVATQAEYLKPTVKVVSAQKYQIDVVSEQWLNDCIAAQQSLPRASYRWDVS